MERDEKDKMEAFPRRTENRVEGEVVLWGNRRILFLKIFAITDGGSSHYDIVSDHLESLSTSVIKILTAGRLNDQCSGLYG